MMLLWKYQQVGKPPRCKIGSMQVNAANGKHVHRHFFKKSLYELLTNKCSSKIKPGEFRLTLGPQVFIF